MYFPDLTDELITINITNGTLVGQDVCSTFLLPDNENLNLDSLYKMTILPPASGSPQDTFDIDSSRECSLLQIIDNEGKKKKKITTFFHSLHLVPLCAL